METFRHDPAPGSIRLLFEVGTVAGMSDGELLERFLARRVVGPEAAEVAFGALVERHGPMVLRVCRSRLGDEHDAQDAFQATFLILARKAGAIRNRDSASSWLQGVARRVATCARRASAVRRAKERSASRSSVEAPTDLDPGELVPAVREEVGDLPEKYRIPLMLCLLDGLTHEEAATRLGWPVGTVKTRVRQAKDRLRTRLTRRGFAPTLGVITAALAAREASAMPLALVRSTARAALRYVSGKSMTTGAASASVAGLVKLGIGSLLMSRIKIGAIVLTSIGACLAGATGYARPGSEKSEPTEPVQVQAEPKAKQPAPAAATVAWTVAPTHRDDQIEALRLDIELLENDVTRLKTSVTRVYHDRNSTEASLAVTNGPSPTETGQPGVGSPLTGEKLEERKRFLTSRLQELEVDFQARRASYLAKNRELNDKKRKLIELGNAPAEEAPTTLKGPESSGGDGPGSILADDERIEQIEQIKLEIQALNGEIASLDFEISQKLLQKTEDRQMLRLLTAPATPGSNGRVVNNQVIAEERANELRKSLPAMLDWLDLTLRTTQKELIAKKRELRHKEQQLERLEKSASKPPTTPTPVNPPSDVESRLADVERKLDQILKALEARPGGK